MPAPPATVSATPGGGWSARVPDDVTPCEASDIESWDDTADVVVVGFGAAGSCAAFSAVEGGARVLVVERTGGPGGAAALAEGIVYLGGGTPIQTACGFEDTVEDMYRYMMAACGPDPDEAKIARYCAESLGHFDWLVTRGVPFDPTFCAETSMAPTGTEGLVYSGGEDAYPFNEIARPAPRGHLAKTKRSTGWLLRAAPGGRRRPARARSSRRTPASTASWSTTAGSSGCRGSDSARRCRSGPAVAWC